MLRMLKIGGFEADMEKIGCWVLGWRTMEEVWVDRGIVVSTHDLRSRLQKAPSWGRCTTGIGYPA